MKLDVVLGLQWGDEGKGKIVDVLANNYPVVARFQGGPNAGHSIHFEGKKFVLHTIPSGVFRDGSVNFIGNGVVIDPIIFKEECLAIEAMGVPVRERVVIADRAHLILPTHRIIDAASEAAKGKGKIGSTLKGIGPTYMDKTGRNGLRVGDILTPNFKERFQYLKNKHIRRKKLTIPQEIRRLNHADYAIALNPSMQKWMKEHGCTMPTGSLDIWDYLSQSHCPPSIDVPTSYKVVYAGALNRRKNAFLYQWGNYIKHYQVSLYGTEPDASSMDGKEHFDIKGFVQFDQLIASADGHFGLVWDGDSIQTCSGNFG